MNSTPLRRVTRKAPCPVCQHGDWCSVSADGALCICMRQAEGARKRSANGGYVHVLRGGGPRPVRQKGRAVRVSTPKPGRTDLVRLARHYQEAATDTALRGLADSLGVSVESLRRLRIGWDERHRAWAFPMVNAAGHVVEIRLRFPDGRKLAVTGGREGLFIPDGLDYSGPLILAEGPTDCAALLDLGFPALGRPSCSGSVRHCVELVRAHWPLDVVVIADGDPPGQRGAEVLASMLLAYAQTVRVIRPPDEIKDARAWKQAGATAADIRTLIAGAPSRRLSIKGVCHD